MKVAIIQSNYIPWKGYFDLIGNADLCVFLDDVQFTKNDWRNRNQILSKNGLEWITVPVGQSIHRLIDEVSITDSGWQELHLKKIRHNYKIGKEETFKNDLLDAIYQKNRWANLSHLNQQTIKLIAQKYLGIKTIFESSSSYNLEGKGESRLLSLLKQMGATSYLSGPAGANYLNPINFSNEGIALDFFTYPSYPYYEQIYTSFISRVSIIDLLLSVGPSADRYLNYKEGLLS